MKSNVNGNTLSLINKVLLLRKVDWGMAEDENIPAERTNEPVDQNYE